MPRPRVPIPLRLAAYFGSGEAPSSVIRREGLTAADRQDVRKAIADVEKMVCDFPAEDWRGRWARQEKASVERAIVGRDAHRREGTEFEDLALSLYEQWAELVPALPVGCSIYPARPTHQNAQRYEGPALLRRTPHRPDAIFFLGDVTLLAAGDEFEFRFVRSQPLPLRPAAGYELLSWYYGMTEYNIRQKISRARFRAGRPRVTFAERGTHALAALPKRRRPRKP
jgi:hypothetical protein